jgi:hypothetical protein
MTPSQVLMDKLHMSEQDMINIYTIGSTLFQVKRNEQYSDDDYLIVLSNDFQYNPVIHTTIQPSVQPVFDNQQDAFIDLPIYEYRSEEVDMTIFRRNEFERALVLGDEVVVECVSLHYYESGVEPTLILLRKSEFKLPAMVKKNDDDISETEIAENRAQIRSSFAKKANNSYSKCKKKLVVERTVADQYVGLKSLFHCLRILSYGIQIVKYGYVANFKSTEEYYDDIVLPFTSKPPEQQSDLTEEEAEELWRQLEQKYKSIKNKLASEMRQLAPMPNKQTPRKKQS